MSATIIEMLIKEASRDGVLTQSEIDSIHKEAESMGVSRALVENLIEEHLSHERAKATEKAEKERQKQEDDKNRKYEIFELTFEKLVRKWICKSSKRILDRNDYLPDLRREAQKLNVDLPWLDSWVAKLEKSEQEIAGIKPQGFLNKFKNMFK